MFSRTSFSEKQGRHIKPQSTELLGVGGKHLQVLQIHREESCFLQGREILPASEAAAPAEWR